MGYLGPGLGVESAVWREGDQTEVSEGSTLHPLEASFLDFVTKTSGFHLGLQLSLVVSPQNMGSQLTTEASSSPRHQCPRDLVVDTASVWHGDSPGLQQCALATMQLQAPSSRLQM